MLHVSLLGERSITDDGAGIQVRSSHAVALVAFLAAHAGAPQPRQRIAGMFWPDSTDAQALTNLRRELHHLRQVLADDRSLVVTPRDLCWRDCGTCRVDLRVFDSERQAALAAAAAGDDAGVLAHAATAVAQYKGDLLPGGYDDWLLEARSELERQCTDLCDLLCTARARTGDLAGAVDAVRRRIQLQPLEEAGYRTLMLLQADLGDRAGAVSTYHHCASVLERELGVIPDPATRQAFQRLMADGDPAGASLPGPQPDAARSGLAAARLVGRSRELGLLQDLWRAAAAGRPGLALVGGGAGVGKTRLVAEIAEMARLQGAVVASSQCFGMLGAAGPGAGGGLAAEPGGSGSGGGARSALAHRSAQAGAGRGARGTLGSLEVNGGCLAAPPVLRGPRAGTDGRRAASAARPGQHAMVRSGDAGLPHLLPRPRLRHPGPGGRDTAERHPRRSPRTR